MDSFKGCLSSSEAGEAIAGALLTGCAGAEVDVMPMTDGGDGMLDVFDAVLGLKRVRLDVHDPMMRNICAEYGVTTAGTAVIEAARACGLTLVRPEKRNPLVATSYGVGEMVAHAVRQGCRDFIVGLGGSATVDAGTGMLRALVDAFAKGGTIDDVLSGALCGCRFTLATDVVNPLCGAMGAAQVYGPQKGASAEAVVMLDRRARRFAAVSARHFGYDRSQQAGAGAAGGLGYAFMQYLDARSENGADLFMDVSRFDDKLACADYVVTGEGSADSQTLMGKLPSRVMSRALRHGVPTVLVAGRVADSSILLEAGFHKVVAATPETMDEAEAMRADVARENLRRAVTKLFRCKTNK